MPSVPVVITNRYREGNFRIKFTLRVVKIRCQSFHIKSYFQEKLVALVTDRRI